jgi:hypothetical protein
LKFAPENKDQWYAFINIIATVLGIILAIVLSNKTEPPQTIIIENHEQEIVQQIEDYIDQRLDEIEEKLAKRSDEKPPPRKHR